MTSMTLTRGSMTAAGAAAITVAAQALNLAPAIPIQHLGFAWTLLRVLLQL